MYYLNTNAQIILFQDTLNSEIYVDKSLLIAKISSAIRTNGKYVCITRPRRFGKTVNVNMLGAYYTKGYDTHDLFRNLAISGREDYETYLKSILKKLKSDLQEGYPVLKKSEYAGMSEMLQATGDSFIFILDEWDAVFYEKYIMPENKVHYLKFLKSFLKDKAYVDLVYMTGVLPIAKYASGSELNMFWEYHFTNDRVFEEYFGLTEEEVKKLTAQHGTVSYEDLEWWYDGYLMSDGRHLFNPRSVSRALTDGVCRNYWTETGSVNEVADCVEHNADEVREDIVKMVAGIPVEADLSGFSEPWS